MKCIHKYKLAFPTIHAGVQFQCGVYSIVIDEGTIAMQSAGAIASMIWKHYAEAVMQMDSRGRMLP